MTVGLALLILITIYFVASWSEVYVDYIVLYLTSRNVRICAYCSKINKKQTTFSWREILILACLNLTYSFSPFYECFHFPFCLFLMSVHWKRNFWTFYYFAWKRLSFFRSTGFLSWRSLFFSPWVRLFLNVRISYPRTIYRFYLLSNCILRLLSLKTMRIREEIFRRGLKYWIIIVTFHGYWRTWIILIARFYPFLFGSFYRLLLFFRLCFFVGILPFVCTWCLPIIFNFFFNILYPLPFQCFFGA